MTRILLTGFLAFMITACQTAPATIPIISSTEAPLPGETSISTPIATQPPTPTIVPTPTISPVGLKDQAGALCEKAYSAPVETKKFDLPYMGMSKTEWDNKPTWTTFNTIPHLFALSKDSLKTIICVLESRRQVGTYTDGSAAFQITEKVRIVSWPEGKVLGSQTFEGGPPPETKIGFGGGYGPYPTGVRSWILDQRSEVKHPDFLFLQDGEIGSAIAISPDGRLVAVGVSDSSDDSGEPSKIMLLAPQDLQTTSTWNAHAGTINDLTFSPDGRIIASTGSDSNIFFWDSQTGTRLGTANLPSSSYVIKYSPDGKFLAASTNSDLYLIDSNSMQVSISYPATGKTFSFSPDGKIIYTDMGSIETMTGNFIHEFYDYNVLVPTISPEGEVSFDMPDFISSFTLSPDGMYGVSYSFEASPDTGNTNLVYTLSVLDAQTAKRLSETQFSAASFDMLGFSPDGKLFAVGIGSDIQLLDTHTWQAVHILTGHTGRILDYAFSLDGKKIISLSTDRTIRVWSLGN